MYLGMGVASNDTLECGQGLDVLQRLQQNATLYTNQSCSILHKVEHIYSFFLYFFFIHSIIYGYIHGENWLIHTQVDPHKLIHTQIHLNCMFLACGGKPMLTQEEHANATQSVHLTQPGIEPETFLL